MGTKQNINFLKKKAETISGDAANVKKYTAKALKLLKKHASKTMKNYASKAMKLADTVSSKAGTAAKYLGYLKKIGQVHTKFVAFGSSFDAATSENASDEDRLAVVSAFDDWINIATPLFKPLPWFVRRYFLGVMKAATGIMKKFVV